MTVEHVASVCPHDCPSTCALEVERLNANTVGRVRGRKDNDYTAGTICAKVARYAERVHHPDRLATPLKRIGAKGEGRFEPIGWGEALDTVADAFRAAAARHGAETVWPYFYAGTMGLVQRDSIHRLRHVMGYSRQLETICASIASAAWTAGAGVLRGSDPRTMHDADLIVFWGINPVATHVNAMAHATQARKTRGATIVCVDPYRGGTAAAADLHLALKPGTDAALACAVMHVLFRDGFADRDYMARYTADADRLEAHVKTRTPQWAAAITGLDAADIEAFAALYAGTERAFIRAGYGMTRSRNGAVSMHAVSCLPAVAGKWRHRGGGALFSNASLFKVDQTVVKGLDRMNPDTRVLDMSRIGPVLTGDPADLGDGPPVTAMLIQNTNPAAVAPETAKVLAGLTRDDLFVCVHEQFMTETARFADIVLPATTFLEHDDLYRGGGQVYLQVAKQVIEPFADARSNVDVVNALAKRLGAEHPGFDMTAWQLIETLLAGGGYPSANEVFASGGVDCSLAFEDMNFQNGFGHPDGRFRFAAAWPQGSGLPDLPDHHAAIEAADADHPFRLIAPPAHQFLNTTFTETPTSRAKEGGPRALIHPDDCGALGVEDGARVRLGNARGSVVVPAKAFDGLQPGVVVVEGIWPNAAFEEGVGINVLIGADAAQPAGGAVFHDTAIWIKRD